MTDARCQRCGRYYWRCRCPKELSMRLLVVLLALTLTGCAAVQDREAFTWDPADSHHYEVCHHVMYGGMSCHTY